MSDTTIVVLVVVVEVEVLAVRFGECWGPAGVCGHCSAGGVGGELVDRGASEVEDAFED